MTLALVKHALTSSLGESVLHILLIRPILGAKWWLWFIRKYREVCTARCEFELQPDAVTHRVAEVLVRPPHLTNGTDCPYARIQIAPGEMVSINFCYYLRQQHPVELNYTSRLFLLQYFGINHNPHVALKTRSSPTTRL